VANPEWLWLLVVVPLFVVRAAVGRARRRRDWAALGQIGGPAGDGSVGWIVAALCLIVALAQPRWGRIARAPLPPGHDVVLALDVSRSMGCEDVVPDRLGRAVEAAEGLVRALGVGQGDRAAVVAFAGRGVLRCPLTQSLGAVVERLHSLRAGDVRPGGTDLGSALDAAAEAFDDQDHAEGRTIVILSDGEDHAGAWPGALDRLRRRDPNVIVHAVAIGDAERGHPVPALARSALATEMLRYQGEVVQSRRNDRVLQAIAGATGGAFLPLGLATTDLGRLYRERIEPVAQARRAGSRAPDLAERYGVFLLAALGLGLAASRPHRCRSLARRGAVSLAVAASLLVLAGAGPGLSPKAGRSASLVAAGRAAYDAGRYREAHDAFARAAVQTPGDPVIWYDVAAASFQLGQYQEALDSYQAARPRARAALRTKIDFALGNSALALGDLPGAIRHYDECTASSARGPGLDEVRRRASANRKFVDDLAHPSPQPPGEGESSPKPRDRSQGGDGQRPGGAGAPAEPGGGSGMPPPARRGPGGAGGSGLASPLPGSPEDRLDRALDNVREALRRRINEPLPAEASRDSKDW